MIPMLKLCRPTTRSTVNARQPMLPSLSNTPTITSTSARPKTLNCRNNTTPTRPIVNSTRNASLSLRMQDAPCKLSLRIRLARLPNWKQSLPANLMSKLNCVIAVSMSTNLLNKKSVSKPNWRTLVPTLLNWRRNSISLNKLHLSC